MLLPNCPEYVIAFYACQRIGAIAVGNNPLYTERELEHQLTDAGISVMIVLDQVYAAFGKIRDRLDIREVIGVKLNRYMGFPLNRLAPLKFMREAKHEGHWPFVPPGHRIRWWTDVMKEAGPAPPVAQRRSPRRSGRLPLYGRHDRAVEGRHAQPSQPRRERDAGERVAVGDPPPARAASWRRCPSSIRSARSP